MTSRNYKGLVCRKCGFLVEPVAAVLRCPRCQGALDASYDYSAIGGHFKLSESRRSGTIWDFSELLPVLGDDSVVSLGEGWTPLIRAEKLGREIGIRHLYLKDEGQNPTASFKDRAISVAVSKAREWGVKAVVTASTGNMAASVAAYAARAGIPAHILVAQGATPYAKLIQTAVCGGTVVTVEGNTTDNAAALAVQLVERLGWYPLMTNSAINPFTMEGAKTAAYEVAQQLGCRSPDWMIVGLGGGQNLSAHWRGFREMRSMDQVANLPKMVAVQAEGCAPFVRAIRDGLSAEEIRPWKDPKTIAGGIADASPWEASLALEAVRKSGGTAVDFADDELLEMVRRVARTEGVFAEPAGAAGVVAASKLRSQGVIDAGDTVVCEVTASGLKQLDEMGGLISLPEPIRPDFDEFARRYLPGSTSRP